MTRYGVMTSLVLMLCFWTVVYLYLDPMDPIVAPSLADPKPCGIKCSDDVAAAYLVNTAGCMIPNFPMEDILKTRRPQIEGFVCSKYRPLTEEKRQHVLFFKDRISDYNLTSDTFNCSYQGIEKGPERVHKLKESVPLVMDKTPIPDDGIVVTCYNNSLDNNTIFYQNVHYFIQPWRAEEKRKLFKKNFGHRSNHPEKLSVLLMGTDAVSRFNAIRHMPKTYRYLMEEVEALDFRGYNKIAENTLPNTYALMTGYTLQDLDKLKCSDKKKYLLDDCPLIWKDFANEGFLTGFGEDVVPRGIFTYRHSGFAKKPVDYFVEDVYRTALSKLSHGVPSFRGFTYSPCVGPRLTVSVMHDHSLAMAEELQDMPYFAFYWSAGITHDHLRMPRVVDDGLVKLLTQFNENGYLNHTVVILISDHGLRYGPFRHTYLGMVEEKLPFCFMVFPPWFKKVYPEAWKNLVTNTKRLISNLDIHETLHSLASGDFASGAERSVKPKYGQSLFAEVPETRICSDVNIPEVFCSCEVYLTASITDESVIAAAEMVTKELNSRLEEFVQCEPLHLDKVLSARLAFPSNNSAKRRPTDHTSTYLIEFQTKPGGAMLEAMVKKSKEFTLLGEVMRTNKYGNQSHCMKHFVLRKYCFCKDLLEPKDGSQR
ncbi:uncharacterized protein [Panulirus ornatus]|uniref:uncharacterized protein n=1 Tax=Panulirus ornatus TaxID=150431 RepID=UPI003A896298